MDGTGMETDCNFQNVNDAAFRSRSSTLPAKLLQARANAVLLAHNAARNVMPSNVHNTLLAQTLMNNAKAEGLRRSPEQLAQNVPNGHNTTTSPYSLDQLSMQQNAQYLDVDVGGDFPQFISCAPPSNGLVRGGAMGSLTNVQASANAAQNNNMTGYTNNNLFGVNRQPSLRSAQPFGAAQPNYAAMNLPPADCAPGGFSTTGSVHVQRGCDSPLALLPTGCCDNSGVMFEPDSSMVAAAAGAGPSKMKPTRRNAWGNASYADLITQAIESSSEKRLTLSQIYDWMVRNVAYFKDKGDQNSSAGWKNSIRHNLSLHARFVRVQNEQTGKVSYWTINYEAIRRERDSVASGASTPRGGGRRRALTLDPAEYDKTRTKLRRRVEATAKQQQQQQQQQQQAYDSCDSQPVSVSVDSPQHANTLCRFDSMPFETGLDNSANQTLFVGAGDGRNVTYWRDSSSPSGVFAAGAYGAVDSPLSSGSLLRHGAVIDERGEADPDAGAAEDALWRSVRLEMGASSGSRSFMRVHSASSATHSVASPGPPPAPNPGQHSPMSALPPAFAQAASASARSTPLQSVSNTAPLASAHSATAIPTLAQLHAFDPGARPGSHGSLASSFDSPLATPLSMMSAAPHGHLQPAQPPAASSYAPHAPHPGHHLAGSFQPNINQNQFHPSAQHHTLSTNLQFSAGSPAAPGSGPGPQRLQTTYSHSPAQSQTHSPQRSPSCQSPVQAICSATRAFLTLDAASANAGIGANCAAVDGSSYFAPGADLDSLALMDDANSYAQQQSAGFSQSDLQAAQLHMQSNADNAEEYRALMANSAAYAQRAAPAGSRPAANRRLTDLLAYRVELDERGVEEQQAQASPVLRAALLGCAPASQFTFPPTGSTNGSLPPYAYVSSYDADRGNDNVNLQLLDATCNAQLGGELALANLSIVDPDVPQQGAHGATMGMLKAPVPLGPRSSIDAIEPSLPMALNSASIPLPSGTASEIHFF